MSDHSCPDCQSPLSEATWIAHVVVCPGCGRTWAREGDELLAATGAHVDVLSVEDLKTAKKRRAPFYRRRGLPQNGARTLPDGTGSDP